MDFNIREAIISDYNDIRELVIEIHNLHVKNRPDIYQNVDNPFEYERFIELLNTYNSKLFIVEDIANKKIIAYSIVQIINRINIRLLVPSKYIYIDDFCVKASRHKRGVGKKLFNYIMDYARLEKVASIQLTVSEFNKAAISFYENIGMTTRNRKMELKL